nr:hypothetical protein BaRGS_011640 [Batillaria attramentaria]
MPVAGEDGRTRWQCPICQEDLSSDHELTIHIRSHNTAQAKQPNTCTICGKVLSSQSSLDRHMLVHSGERPFKCKICKMSFTTNENCIINIIITFSSSTQKKRTAICTWIFLDFTTDKFSLAAKACSDLLHTHMHKHIADKAMVESLCTDKSENAGKPDSMGKGDFLAMFELAPSEEVTSSQKNETVLESISKAQNDEYFAKVGRKKHEKVEKEEIEKAITYNKYTTDLSTALDNFHSPDTVGFSMKANCIRHIQKQHLDVPQMDIEQFIHVNELSQSAADNDETDDILQGIDDVSCSPASTPGLPAPGSTQPVAHPMPEADSIAGAREFPEPLDFSLKNPVMAARLSDMFSPMMRAALTGLGQEDTHEQPIDLTQNTAAAKKLPISMTPDLPCHLCKKTFGSKEDLLSHLRDVHQVPVNPLSVDSSFPISDSNNNTSATLICDLASVNKILDATDAQKIQAFLKPTSAANSGSDDSEPQSATWESADDDSDQSLDQLYAQSLRSAAIKAEQEAVKQEESYENDVMDDEEMEEEEEGQLDDRPENDGDSDSRNDQEMDRSNSEDDVLVTRVDGVKNDMPRDKHSPEGVAGKAGQKPFKCPRCPVTFSTKSNRERHLIRKHGVNIHIDDNDEDSSDNNQPQNDLGYPPLSSSAFSGSAERHINPERDNYNVDKITHCWKCGEEFNSRKLLVRHLKEHNIDLPFKCYLCDASYDSRQECLTHQEKMHSSDWSILKYAERLDRIVERNCKTGQFLEEGDDADGLGLAGMEDGQGERPFECDKCQKRFTLKHSMMRHRRKHTTGGIPDSPTVLSEDEDSIQGDNPSKGPASNAGTGHRALRQHLALAAALNKPIVSAVLRQQKRRHLRCRQLLPKRKRVEKRTMVKTFLHNLLGVESATIDQIFDAKDSAASLLGVKDKVT